jgi:hypothetical protein
LKGIVKLAGKCFFSKRLEVIQQALNINDKELKKGPAKNSHRYC